MNILISTHCRSVLKSSNDTKRILINLLKYQVFHLKSPILNKYFLTSNAGISIKSCKNEFLNSSLPKSFKCKFGENRFFREHCSQGLSDTRKKINSEKEQNKLWTIPNLLCCARITASPVICYYILNSEFNLALGILFMAGVSDFADGLIARKFPNQASKIGTFLDPLADKVLVVTLFSCLTYTGAVPYALTLLIVFRDFLLLTAGFYIRYVSLSPPKTVKKFFDGSQSTAELRPTYLSKVNTAIQLFTAAISLYAPNIPFLPTSVIECSWCIAGCSTILSGLSYAVLRKKTYSISRKRE